MMTSTMMRLLTVLALVGSMAMAQDEHIMGSIPDELSGFFIGFPRKEGVEAISFRCRKRILRGIKKIAAAGGFLFSDFDTYYYDRTKEEDELRYIKRLCVKKDWVHSVNGVDCSGFDDPTVDTEDLGFDENYDTNAYYRRGLITDQEELTEEELEEEKRRLFEERELAAQRELFPINRGTCKMLVRLFPGSAWANECYDEGLMERRRRMRNLREELSSEEFSEEPLVSGRELQFYESDPVGDKIRMETKALEFCMSKLSDCINCTAIVVEVF